MSCTFLISPQSHIVTAFEDPKVSGVTLYLSDFDRPAIEKLGNIFDDPSSASLTCVQTGPIIGTIYVHAIFLTARAYTM